MRALIDGDVVVYRAGFSAQRTCCNVIVLDDNGDVDVTYFDKAIKKKDIEEWHDGVDNCQIGTYIDVQPEHYAVHNVNKIMTSILEHLGTKNYSVYLQNPDGKPNFRNEIATLQPYKAGRQAKPIHYKRLREHLILKWNAELVEGMEVDDKLGIEQWRDFSNYYLADLARRGNPPYSGVCDTVICSIDKDLKMIPGNHYNIVDHSIEFINEAKALENFYKQLLTGDRIDNVPGLTGIGPKKAEKILAGCKTEKEMYDAVYKKYVEYGMEDYITEIGKLLWIMREEGKTWSPPL
jgi:5'-3' exonuclease